MRFSVVAAGLFATLTMATPFIKREEDCPDTPPCMTLAQATQVANNFQTLIANYSNATALAVLAPNFQDNSDSVIELINSGCTGPLPLGQPTFDSRAAFMAGQGSQPPIPFQILNIWQTCDTVIMRWRTTVAPSATEFVTGIIILETTYQDSDTQPFLINTVYSEFNSGAWLVDLGVFKPTCPAASKRSVASLPFRMA